MQGLWYNYIEFIIAISLISRLALQRRAAYLLRRKITITKNITIYQVSLRFRLTDE